MRFEPHPLANLFPLLDGAELAALAADIKANGLHNPIDIYQGKILDGRNRYNAMLAADVEPDKQHVRYFRPELSGDPLKYVISLNLPRRHLNESQRALVAARIGRMPQGARTDLSPIGEKSQGERAAIMNVGKRTVERADDVIDRAEPEIVRAVERGQLSISAAAMAARKLGREQQLRVAARAADGDERAAQTVLKQETRAVRERVLGERQRALPDVKAGLIVEDYEWDDEVWSRDTGMDRHAGNHYPTSDAAHTPEEIAARRSIESIVDPRGCVLAMWSTNQHLWIAMRVMALRGFEYKTNYAWGKDHISLGRWNRSKHELLLIGTRGDPPCPAPGTQWDSLLLAPKGEHSAKPECFLEMLEQYFPTLVKIELNRRGAPRPGWTAWGNEAESSNAPCHADVLLEIANQ